MSLDEMIDVILNLALTVYTCFIEDLSKKIADPFNKLLGHL